jgi:hypothetical protein
LKGGGWPWRIECLGILRCAQDDSRNNDSESA